jgi:hypothetical protein
MVNTRRLHGPKRALRRAGWPRVMQVGLITALIRNSGQVSSSQSLGGCALPAVRPYAASVVRRAQICGSAYYWLGGQKRWASQVRLGRSRGGRSLS